MKTYTQNRLGYHTLRTVVLERVAGFVAHIRTSATFTAWTKAAYGVAKDLYNFAESVIDLEEKHLRRFLFWLDKETERPFVNWRTVGLLSVAAVVLLPIWFVLLVFS